MDKLQVIQNLAAEEGPTSRIFKAIADPPTTSLQRLKGLTTGGLPTFVDVGNSFGAPAIVEDNFIQQLVENGKRVVMMGDDTWLQLFPHHFKKSFPYPSFNVKDLDTVDNGCIEHLIPSLHDEDWDVLIAHFLGVDHAGHIFGVNTMPMIQKLEQYNSIMEEVVEALKSQSGAGGLHENTLLVVMGDHGQTLNGDHGGGSPEEVETSIFAMSFKNGTFSLPSELDSVSCGLNVDAKPLCVGTIEQLDFAVTISAMLGVPFPFGSIGRVNPQLYSLGAGNFLSQGIKMEGHENDSNIVRWMQHYVNALCINAWQVKRYIDVYSASSVIGFPSEDLLHVADMYSQAQENWLHVVKGSLSHMNESCPSSSPALMRQIDMYAHFLDSVIGLARSKWTEFNLKLMVVGLSIIFLSLLVQVFAIKRMNTFYESSLSTRFPEASVGLVFSVFAVIIRACSFLSNSYILEEGKVALFFLGTSVILELRNSINKAQMLLEGALFLLLVSALRFIMEFGLSKQADNLSSVASMLGTTHDHLFGISLSSSVSVLALLLLAYLLLKYVCNNSCQWVQKYVILGTILCYALIALHWILDSELLNLPVTLQYIGKSNIPRVIYAVGIAQLVALVINQLFIRKRTLYHLNDLTSKIIAMLSAWSSAIILLSGKQGSVVALTSVGAAFCIMRLENLWQDATDGTSSNVTFYSLPTTQWSLLAVVLFFCSGHWCAFDGLRYGAAFVGFDEFMLVRQAILLAIDTFGFSLLLPIFGLPILITQRHSNNEKTQSKLSVSAQLSQVYLMYGCMTTISVACMVLCVTIQRRHLMVWGLFAPKYVFDVVGLLLTDVLVCLATLYYIDPVEDDSKQN
uniref:GPI ethanolamine phosphate transferase 2 C-terminal domain-containing protein n=2 Tax=Chenopodium quinoa TaxID=63459 RepID=A0A803LWD1_CHEQI